MGEKRKADAKILLYIRGKKPVTCVDLFKSEQFNTTIRGRFRLRFDGKWHKQHGKYSFYTIDDIVHSLGDALKHEFT